MLSISSLYYLVIGFFSGPKANGKAEAQSPKEKDLMPAFDPTSFTEERYLPELNRLRQEELWRTGFTATIPRENYELREQMFLRRMQEIISKKTILELHDLVSSQENDFLVRRMGAAELVNRGDKTAGLTFSWCIVVDDDDVLRKICAIGLGELGRKVDLGVLENVKEDAWIYDDAQDAIKKILKHETSITVL